MDEEQQNILDYYAENLKAEEYFEDIAAAWKEAPELWRFMLMFINDVLRSGRFKGSKLLEVGSGAIVHNIATASAYFSNITMSDYVQDNVDHLKRWLKGESSFNQFLDIPAGLEGYGNDLEAGRKILESRIRKNVKRAIRCDVLSDKILLESSDDPETSPPFDMIISALCLEAAPKDLDGYYSILKRISNFLRTGGGLLVCGFFKGGKWRAGGKDFHHIQLEESDLLDGLAKAGFGKIDIKTLSCEGQNEIDYNYDKLYCVAAEKL